MNEEVDKTGCGAPPPALQTEGRPPNRIRPSNTYYHANGKGTGSAISFELHPAHDNTPGSLFVELAPQKSVGSRTGAQVSFPTFDWEKRIVFKLDKTDLSQFLQVFRGIQEDIFEGKGLFHRSRNANTIIRFGHQIEPRPGYMLNVSRRSSDGTDQQGYFFFTPSEAFELSVAIESAMLFIVFGVPAVIPRTMGASAVSRSA